jgi:drug/metabolite transporter (DMT)-like permease
MENWLKYSLYIVIFYTLWTIVFEYIIKRYTDCFCIILITYVLTGILALLYLQYHIKTDCKIFNNIGDIKKIPNIILLFMVIIALSVLITNKLWIKALENNTNAGYVGSIANMYIIFVTLISAYLFQSKLTLKNIGGIIIMLGGAYLLST